MGNKKGAGRFSAWGKVCAGVLCAAMTVVLAGDVRNGLKAEGSSVSGLQDDLNRLQQENAARDQKIKELGADIDNNKEAMGLVSEQIDGINNEIDKYSRLVAAKKQEIDAKGEQIANVEKSISEKEDEIETKKDDIAELRKKNDENLAKFAKLARAMYMNDTSNKIPVLNGSDDWYDYFVYSDVVKNISGQNAKFMQELLDSIKEQEGKIESLNAEIASLENDKQELKSRKEELEADLDGLSAEQSKFEADVAEKKNYLYGLSADNAALQQRVDNLEYENAVSWKKMEEINAQIEELIRQANAGNEPVTGSSTDYIWPLDTRFQYITTYFGYDPWRNGNHGGIDVGNAGIANANIYAAQEGTVIATYSGCPHNYGKNYSCCAGGFGNYIIIKHPNGYATLYAHLSSLNVSEGQYVSQGQVIGLVGTTGWSTGYHLHFEVRTPDGTRTNPLNYTYVNL